jgi:hypothetical protein
MLVTGPTTPSTRIWARRSPCSNSEIFGNALFTVLDGLRVGLELSWWRTAWVDRPTATAVRAEMAAIYAF